jgi:hypothetical protein
MLSVSNLSSVSLIDFELSVVCELLQGEAGIALELPDQKTRGFVVQIVLPR